MLLLLMQRKLREWLSGGAPPCQGGGRGFDPRLALYEKPNYLRVIRFFYVNERIRCAIVLGARRVRNAAAFLNLHKKSILCKMFNFMMMSFFVVV